MDESVKAYQVQAANIGKIISAPKASLGPNEIAVKIIACGLNFADLLMLKGTYQDTPELPFIPGLELAGLISDVGAKVTEFDVGDRVAVFSGKGGLATHGVFKASSAVKLPDTMDFITAAGFQIAYGTSQIALDHCARLQAGETLLVTGAAGGVGLTAVEIGKKMGARVVAHARGAEKLAIAEKAGADILIEDGEDLRARLKELGGADVVYDAIGGDVWNAAFRATNPGGRLLPIGFAGGDVPQIPANHLLVKNLTVIGLYIGGYQKTHPQIIRQSFEKLFRWHAEGALHPHVSHVLPLDQVEDALDLLRQRKSTGKVVVTMD